MLHRQVVPIALVALLPANYSSPADTFQTTGILVNVHILVNVQRGASQPTRKCEMMPPEHNERDERMTTDG